MQYKKLWTHHILVITFLLGQRQQIISIQISYIVGCNKCSYAFIIFLLEYWFEYGIDTDSLFKIGCGGNVADRHRLLLSHYWAYVTYTSSNYDISVLIIWVWGYLSLTVSYQSKEVFCNFNNVAGLHIHCIFFEYLLNLKKDYICCVLVDGACVFMLNGVGWYFDGCFI